MTQVSKLCEHRIVLAKYYQNKCFTVNILGYKRCKLFYWKKKQSRKNFTSVLGIIEIYNTIFSSTLLHQLNHYLFSVMRNLEICVIGNLEYILKSTYNTQNYVQNKIKGYETIKHKTILILQ